MLVADSVISVAYQIEIDFAILMRQRYQFAPGMFFWRSTFVRVNVRIVAAEHSMVRAVQRLQAQHVCPGTIESEKYLDACAEVLFKLRDGRPGIRIIAVGHDVSLVSACDCFEDFRVNSRVIVAGKAATGLGRDLGHKETM
jgi:hypothetical protein